MAIFGSVLKLVGKEMLTGNSEKNSVRESIIAGFNSASNIFSRRKTSPYVAGDLPVVDEGIEAVSIPSNPSMDFVGSQIEEIANVLNGLIKLTKTSIDLKFREIRQKEQDSLAGEFEKEEQRPRLVLEGDEFDKDDDGFLSGLTALGIGLGLLGDVVKGLWNGVKGLGKIAAVGGKTLASAGASVLRTSVGAIRAGAATISNVFKSSLGATISQAPKSAIVFETFTKTQQKQMIEKASRGIISKSLRALLPRSIPIIGTAVGLGFAASRIVKGDWIGAGLDAVSGIGSVVTALPAVITSIARDVYKDIYGIFPERDPRRVERFEAVRSNVEESVSNFIKENNIIQYYRPEDDYNNPTKKPSEGSSSRVLNPSNTPMIFKKGVEPEDVSGVFPEIGNIPTDSETSNIGQTIQDNEIDTESKQFSITPTKNMIGSLDFGKQKKKDRNYLIPPNVDYDYDENVLKDFSYAN